MKKIYLITSFSFLSVLGFSQKSAIRFQVGYGVPIAKSSILSYVNGNTLLGTYGSYGAGVTLQAGYQYSVSKMIAVELDAAYLIGRNIKSSYPNASSPTTGVNQSSYSRFVEIAPLLKFSFNGGEENERFKPYAGVGPVIGFGNYYRSYESYGSSSTFQQLARYGGSASLGAKTVVGISLSSGKFSYYAELSMVYMNYSPKKGGLTKYEVNGVDELSSLTVSQKQVVYSTSIPYTSSTPVATQPSQQLKYYAPFSSLGLNFGVMIRLGSEVRRQ